MKKTVPGIEIPEGESCSFPDGRKCALFDWGLEGPAFCAGWGCVSLSGNSLKHSQCLALCGIVSEKPVLAGEKDFQNPKKSWEYTGKFSLELGPNVPKELIPNSPEISVGIEKDRMVVTFTSVTGRVDASGNGITIHNYGVRELHWQYRNIKAIRDGEGKLLWKSEKRKKVSQPRVSQRRVRRAQNLD